MSKCVVISCSMGKENINNTRIILRIEKFKTFLHHFFIIFIILKTGNCLSQTLLILSTSQ